MIYTYIYIYNDMRNNDIYIYIMICDNIFIMRNIALDSGVSITCKVKQHDICVCVACCEKLREANTVLETEKFQQLNLFLKETHSLVESGTYLPPLNAPACKAPAPRQGKITLIAMESMTSPQISCARNGFSSFVSFCVFSFVPSLAW
eukprot:COSAG06_NODE_1719_length_8590_cov_18.960311_12_plen_148_part_00